MAVVKCTIGPGRACARAFFRKCSQTERPAACGARVEYLRETLHSREWMRWRLFPPAICDVEVSNVIYMPLGIKITRNKI